MEDEHNKFVAVKANAGTSPEELAKRARSGWRVKRVLGVVGLVGCVAAVAVVALVAANHSSGGGSGDAAASTDASQREALTSSSPTTVSIFGSKWYKARTDFDLDQSSSKITWTLKNEHLENDGLATHFSGVKLDTDKPVTFKLKWKSGGKGNSDCGSKYWEESKYDYQCYEPGEGYKDDIVPACWKQPQCLVNTGDFRLVLADSNGQKISKDGFGSLDDVSTKWQGFHLRFHPHAGTKLEHHSPHIPCSPYMRESSGGLFSTDSMGKQEIWDGCFALDPYDESTMEITITKKSSKEFDLSFELNGHTYTHTYNFPTSSYVPNEIDTFALAEPNLRGYDLVELSKP